MQFIKNHSMLLSIIGLFLSALLAGVFFENNLRHIAYSFVFVCTVFVVLIVLMYLDGGDL